MAVELTFEERRVLGVLIEKGFTTPDQYPLSLNAVVVGSNQKSCREPMMNIDEARALRSLDSLRQKGFTTLVRQEGSRVDKWKHRFGETLALNAKEVSILAELLLRGPQTDGELRQRASRMRPLETLEEVEEILESLRVRPEPLVERLGPPGRRRGVKYCHLFYPASERPKDDGEYDDEPAADTPRPAYASEPAASPVAPAEPSYAAPRQPAAPPNAGASSETIAELKQEIAALKERVTSLEETFVKFLR